MKKVMLFFSLVFASFSVLAQDTTGFICSTPYMAAFSSNANSAYIVWSASPTATSFTLQYRSCADSIWTSVNNLPVNTNPVDSNVFLLGNLAACKCYVVRIRANCTTNLTSDWRTAEFKTGGCVEPCRAPTQLFAASRDSMASLNWSSMGTNRAYVIEWKPRTDSIWKTQTSSTNSLVINRLQPCSEYQFRVKTVCSATDMSVFSDIAKFKTSGCIAPCGTPRDVRVLSSSRDLVYLSWITTGARAYEVSYTVADSAPRTQVVTANVFRLANITTCKNYKFKVRSICGTVDAPIYSEWSSTTSVLTEGCARCESPSRLSYTVTETTAIVKWDTTGRSGMTYEIQWTGLRDSIWRTVSGVRGNQYSLGNLATCSWYMFRIKTNCTGVTSSIWSAPIRFQTKGCATVCLAPNALRVYVADTISVLSWVGVANNYKLTVTSEDGSFARELGVTGNVYSLTGLARCTKYKVQLKAICSNTSVSDIVGTSFETKGCTATVLCTTPREVSFQADSNKVTVKWLNMGALKYYVEYKLLADSLATWKRDSTTSTSLTLSNLQTCKTYLIRIASVCSTGVSLFNNFTFTTVGCPVSCLAPMQFGSEIVNDTTANVKFNVDASQIYTVQYRLAGTATWNAIEVNTIVATSLPVRITGLKKCTVYQWRVIRRCATGVVESALQSFTTTGCVAACTALPRDLVVTTTATDSAKLTWIMPSTNLTYEVRYGAIIDSSFLTANSVYLTTNIFVMRGLVACRYYAVQVRTICPNGQVSDWVTKSFRLGTACLIDGQNVEYVSEFGVYPNPGSDVVEVAYKVEKEADIKVELMNLQGQVLNRLDGGNQEEGNYIQTLDNLNNLHNGIYFIVIRANGKVVNTQKWQKQ